MELVWKRKTHILAELHKTDLHGDSRRKNCLVTV